MPTDFNNKNFYNQFIDEFIYGFNPFNNYQQITDKKFTVKLFINKLIDKLIDLIQSSIYWQINFDNKSHAKLTMDLFHL